MTKDNVAYVPKKRRRKRDRMEKYTRHNKHRCGKIGTSTIYTSEKLTKYKIEKKREAFFISNELDGENEDKEKKEIKRDGTRITRCIKAFELERIWPKPKSD